MPGPALKMESKQMNVDRSRGSKRDGFAQFVKCRSTKREVSEDSSSTPSTQSPDIQSMESPAEGAEHYLSFRKKLVDIDDRRNWTVVQTRGSKPAPRFNHGAAVVGRKLLVIGGQNGSEIRNDVQMLHLGKLSWSKIGVGDSAPSNGLPVKKGPAEELPYCTGHKLISWGKTVILVGGQMDPAEDRMTVWSFDLEMDCWKPVITKGEIPAARSGHSVTRAGAMLIIFGGEDGKGRKLSDLHILDLKSLMWLPLNPSGKGPSGRARHVADMYDDRFLLIFGGETKSKISNDIYALDFDNMNWSKLRSKGNPPACRAGHAGVLVGDRWYIAGGESRIPGLLDTTMLDISQMEWSVVASASADSVASLKGLSVVFVQRKEKKFLVAVGGCGSQATNAVQVLQIPPDDHAPRNTLAGLLQMPTTPSPESVMSGRNGQLVRTQPSCTTVMGSTIPCACVGVAKTNLIPASEHRISSQRSSSRSVSEYSVDMERDSGLVPLRKRYAMTQSARMDPLSLSSRMDPLTHSSRMDPLTHSSRMDPLTQSARMDPLTHSFRLDPSSQSSRMDAPPRRSVSQNSSLDTPARRSTSRSSTAETNPRRSTSHITSWDTYSTSSRRKDLELPKLQSPAVAGSEGSEWLHQSAQRIRGDLQSTDSTPQSVDSGLLRAEDLQITPQSVRPGLVSGDAGTLFLQDQASVSGGAGSCKGSPQSSEFSGYAETFVSGTCEERNCEHSLASSLHSADSTFNMSSTSPDFLCLDFTLNSEFPEYEEDLVELSKETQCYRLVTNGAFAAYEEEDLQVLSSNRRSTSGGEDESTLSSTLDKEYCTAECRMAVSHLRQHHEQKLAAALQTSELLATQYAEALTTRDEAERTLLMAIQSRQRTEGRLTSALRQIKDLQEKLSNAEITKHELTSVADKMTQENTKLGHDLAVKITLLEDANQELHATRGVLLGEGTRAFQLQMELLEVKQKLQSSGVTGILAPCVQQPILA